MNLPSGWVLAPLADVTSKVGSGATPRGGEAAYKASGIPLIRSMNVHFDGIRYDGLAYLDPDQARALDGVTVAADDVLLNITGASIGRVATAPADLAGARVNQHVSIIRLLDGVTPSFVWRWLASPGMQRVVADEESGATRQAITKDKILDLQLPVAPLNEQHRIVAKLDAIFDQTRVARARLERLPALLDKFKRSILAAAFRGDLTKDWRVAHPDIEPASVLLHRIRDERRLRWEDRLRAKGKDPNKATYDGPAAIAEQELPELPTNWCWASVDDVSDLQLGQQRAPVHAAAEETHPYMRAANIKWSGLDLSDVKRMGFPDPERYRLREGDVLLSEASGSASEVGKPAIWRSEIPGCCYQKTLLRARPVSADVSSEWLHAAFLADALLGRFARMAPGVGILHLTAERMLSWPMPIAPADEQQEIVARIAAAMDAVARLEVVATKTLRTAERLEQSVLAKAFRGELVPQDPNDEPASVLIDRIRAARAAEPAKPHGARSPRRNDTRQTKSATPFLANGHASTAQHDVSLDLVVAVFQQGNPRLTAIDISKSTGLDGVVVKQALKALVDGGQVRVHGRARDATYEWSV